MNQIAHGAVLDGGPPTTAAAGETPPSAAAIIQERLGVNPEAAADLASIAVRGCTPAGEKPTLGDFVTSEHATEMADAVLSKTREAMDKGETVGKALTGALGFAAIEDPARADGLARVVPGGSKKKYPHRITR